MSLDDSSFLTAIGYLFSMFFCVNQLTNWRVLSFKNYLMKDVYNLLSSDLYSECMKPFTTTTMTDIMAS